MGPEEDRVSVRAAEAREAATVRVLDCVEGILEVQGALGRALGAGCMDLASVRYSAGPHALDHFKGCALTGSKAPRTQPVRLFFDAVNQMWYFGVPDASREGGDQEREGVEYGGEERVDGKGHSVGSAGAEGVEPTMIGTKASTGPSGGKQLCGAFYGPPALRSAAEFFRGALEAVPHLLRARQELAEASGCLADCSE